MGLAKQIKTKLEKIQASDRASKNRWFIGMTAISMLVVIGLWLIYLDWSFNSFSNSAVASDSSVEAWQVFKNGLADISRVTTEGFGDIFSKAAGGRTLEIEQNKN